MKEIILRLIYEAIDEVNDALEDDHIIEKRLDSKLCCFGTHIDSLMFVSLIESVERKLEEFYQQEILISVDRITQSSYNQPLTIASFSEIVLDVVVNRVKKQKFQ